MSGPKTEAARPASIAAQLAELYKDRLEELDELERQACAVVLRDARPPQTAAEFKLSMPEEYQRVRAHPHDRYISGLGWLVAVAILPLCVEPKPAFATIEMFFVVVCAFAVWGTCRLLINKRADAAVVREIASMTGAWNEARACYDKARQKADAARSSLVGDILRPLRYEARQWGLDYDEVAAAVRGTGGFFDDTGFNPYNMKTVLNATSLTTEDRRKWSYRRQMEFQERRTAAAERAAAAVEEEAEERLAIAQAQADVEHARLLRAEQEARYEREQARREQSERQTREHARAEKLDAKIASLSREQAAASEAYKTRQSQAAQKAAAASAPAKTSLSVEMYEVTFKDPKGYPANKIVHCRVQDVGRVRMTIEGEHGQGTFIGMRRISA